MSQGVNSGNALTVDWQVVSDIGPLAHATTRPNVELAPEIVSRFKTRTYARSAVPRALETEALVVLGRGFSFGLGGCGADHSDLGDLVVID